MTIYVGIDWDQKAAVFAAGQPGQTISWRGEVPLSTQKVEDWMRALKTRFPDEEEFCVAIERGLPLWERLFQHVGCTVFSVDPNRAKAFANSVNASGAKSDRADAQVLFALAQTPAVRRHALPPTNDLHNALWRAVKRHERLAKDITRITNRIRARLVEVFAGIEISSLRRAWVVKLLTAIPTAFHAQQLSGEQLAELLAGLRMREKTRSQLHVSIQKASHQLLPREAAVIAEEIRGWVCDLQRAESQLKEVETQTDELLAERSESVATLTSVKGIGKGLCARLIALYFLSPDAGSHRDGASIRIGASPVTVQSGAKSRWKERQPQVKMRRSAPVIGRQAVYLLGMQAIRHLRWAKAQYQYLRAKGKGHGTALRSVTRSLLRILTALWKSGKDYDELRYINALKSKGVVWAAQL